jgi:DNA polymerase (family 10)
VSALGLAKIAALSRALGVTTVAELRAACEAGRVRAVKGWGRRPSGGSWSRSAPSTSPVACGCSLPDALGVAEPFVAHCRAIPGVRHADYAGDLRRRRKPSSRWWWSWARAAPRRRWTRALASPLIAAVGAREADGARATLSTGMGLELRVVPPARYAAALLDATGSPAHVEHLSRLARARGVSLDEGEFAGEAEIYRRLGLTYVPPELREDAGEIEAAADGSLPRDLVREEDVQGFVHCHTVYSDGRHSVAQMARAAEAQRPPLSHHHRPLAHRVPTRAGSRWTGSTPSGRRLPACRRRCRCGSCVGTESDILADGSLDYPDAVLERLDIVIASVHARHRMGAAEMTRRITRAMAHPCFKVWGHALGRLVLSRPPIDCRVEEILDVIAASRAAVEINGDPNRLDLPPRWIRAARERGIPFVISTDAHAIDELRISATEWRWRAGAGCGAARCSIRGAPRPSRARCRRRRAVMSRVFLLSPAYCGGVRAGLVFDDRARFDLARQVRAAPGAPLGEVFSFLSGLYFRGKLAYAEAFARPPRAWRACSSSRPPRGCVPPTSRWTCGGSGAMRRWTSTPMTAAIACRCSATRAAWLATRAPSARSSCWEAWPPGNTWSPSSACSASGSAFPPTSWAAAT